MRRRSAGNDVPGGNEKHVRPIELKPLIGRLNDVCRRGLEAAAGVTALRTHYNVEIEHLLIGLLDRSDTDLAAILRKWDVEPARLLADLNRSLERMKTGNARAPALSPDIVDMVKQGWLLASVEQGANRVRSGHLLWALLADDMLARRAREASGHLAQIPPDTLKSDYLTICANTAEAAQATSQAVGSEAAGTGSGEVRPGGSGALDQFTIDLTAQAKAGKIDPILGRDFEIRQMVDILTRRRQNNPILTGEAGVGKTAVVEGLALRIAAGDVPPALRDVTLRTLDLGLLQAGAGVKGEFENRLKSVIEETKASPKPIILFIDEAHTLIGAGGAAGQNDAANLLKPALARGELRTIAATTWAEYKKYFEKDAALTRRFQTVKVEEPSEKVATAMIRGLVSILELHHKVRILDEAVSEAVRLSARYIPARQLPDKAVSLIDTACARVAMSQNAIPAPIDDRQRRIGLIDTELKIVEREMSSGADHTARRDELTAERLRVSDELAALQKRWEEERAIVTEIDAVRGSIDAALAAKSGAAGSAGNGAAGNDGQADRAKLAELSTRLRALQGEQPLIFPVVDGQAIAEIVEGWTGIPGPPDAVRRDPHRAQPARGHGAPRHRPKPCHGSRRASHPHQPRRPDRSTPADRRLPARRHVGRRQDRNGPQPRPAALWRRAERDDDQHVGVQGRAQSQPADGQPAGLCRLRRRRCSDRSGAAAALQCGAARRDGKSPFRCSGRVLLGVRQGQHEGRRRPRHRFQEHRHHHDEQCRHRSDHQAVRRSRNGAGCRGPGRSAAAGAGEISSSRPFSAA